MLIDSHAHPVSSDTVTYPPTPLDKDAALNDLKNPMTVERLLTEMDASGVSRAVLVQRSVMYSFDCSYVCDSAAKHPQRFAAVCPIDATQPDCAEKVHYWVKARGAAGVRFFERFKGMDISWLDSPLARDAWKAAAELEVPVSVHFFPWNRVEALGRLTSILRAIPRVQLVLDHLAAMQSDAGPPDHGVDEWMEGIARFDNVTAKFTTIPLGRLKKAGVDSRPVVRRVRDLFGAERMMWGSDIMQSPGTYAEMAALGRHSVEGLSEAEQEMILSNTAMRIYGRTWRSG